eukprot:GHVT01046044.1.p2 GENE.GHVT01046044.1~~GHVT01046044.1.p2  ORF type:complete len:105 (+),score=1.64 GHVT01046044.1:867-1181(+)
MNNTASSSFCQSYGSVRCCFKSEARQKTYSFSGFYQVESFPFGNSAALKFISVIRAMLNTGSRLAFDALAKPHTFQPGHPTNAFIRLIFTVSTCEKFLPPIGIM